HQQPVRGRVVERTYAGLGPGRALDLALAQAAEQLHLEMVVTLAQRRAPFAGKGLVAALEVVDRRGRDAGGLGRPLHVRSLGQRGEERRHPPAAVGFGSGARRRAPPDLRLGHRRYPCQEGSEERVVATRTIAIFLICTTTAL